MQLREVARELRLFKLLLGHMLSLLFGGNEFAPHRIGKVKRGAKPRDGRAALPIGGYSSQIRLLLGEPTGMDPLTQTLPHVL